MEYIAAVPLLSIDDSDTKTDNLIGRQTIEDWYSLLDETDNLVGRISIEDVDSFGKNQLYPLILSSYVHIPQLSVNDSVANIDLGNY